MLGHRGCRIAISYPEIYEMQVRAIFEAAYALQNEKISVHPEIMVPIVMNFRELKQIVYGKKIEGHAYQGIVSIEESVRSDLGVTKPIDYKIGTMIELPAAALSADEIARYAQFFSFGTNDLTQTTLGLSRDDFTSFMPDYTMYDLIDGNPFAILDPRVRKLIDMAVRLGTAARPDLVKGLCGEHGARPENIRFCMEAGLNYVSCSSYSVPIALLSIAQIELDKAEKEGRKLVQKMIPTTVAVKDEKAAAPKAKALTTAKTAKSGKTCRSSQKERAESRQTRKSGKPCEKSDSIRRKETGRKSQNCSESSGKKKPQLRLLPRKLWQKQSLRRNQLQKPRLPLQRQNRQRKLLQKKSSGSKKKQLQKKRSSVELVNRRSAHIGLTSFFLHRGSGVGRVCACRLSLTNSSAFSKIQRL